MLSLRLPDHPDRPLSVLALGAHPDDIEIGAGGTLLTLAESQPGLPVRYVVLTGTPERQDEARHAVHRILVGARPRHGEIEDALNWPAYELIWPHLGPSQAEECTDTQTRQLLLDWVRYLWMRGDYEACLSLAQRLQNLWTHVLGRDHSQTLYLQSQIANVLRFQGRFNEARDLDTYVLERQRQELGILLESCQAPHRPRPGTELG